MVIEKVKGDKMLKRIIIILLLINSFAFASEEVILDYKPKQTSENFLQKHVKILKNLHLDIDIFGMFSLVDDRYQKEYGSYIKDRHDEDLKLFTLTYKF